MIYITVSAKLESRSLFIEATLWKTFQPNYGNKLHLDYAAYEKDIEQAVSSCILL